MCGIVGVVGDFDDQVIARMNDLIVHRGPDDEGYYHDPSRKVHLGMRRLSIVDLSGGHQPMSDGDENVWIVFNGEIFNAPELRKELEQKGYQFRTRNSDTEVLIHLYRECGEAMVGQLNGMFGFCIYDKLRGRLFGARDPLGIKPYYVVQTPNGLAFSSELKSLLAVPDLNRELNLEGIYHYFSLLYIPGTHSVFRQVKRIGPGCSWSYSIDNKAFQTNCYWKPNFQNTRERSIEEWTTRLRSSFSEAVDRWTLSDVPVGSSLSGGIDSCAITGLMAKREDTELRTYTVGFKDHEDSAHDETLIAERFAATQGTLHRTLRIEAKTVLNDLLKMVWHLDEPYAGGLPSWCVYQLMAQDLKVGMTGSGGDELFSNYGYFSKYESNKFLRRYLKIYPYLKPLIASISGANASFRYPVGSSFDALRQYWNDCDKQHTVFLDQSVEGWSSQKWIQELFDASKGRNARDGIAYIGLTQQLPEEFLMMTDRFSMAHSIEARTPFLDKQFVEFALSIPSETRIGNYDLKYLFKAAHKDLLPPEVYQGKKSGFTLPLGRWLRTDLKPVLSYFVGQERLKQQGIFRSDFWETTIAPHLSGKVDFTYRIWPMLMFQIWHFLWIEQKIDTCPASDIFEVVGSRN